MAADATKSISNVGGGGYMPPTMEERTMPGSMGGGGDYAFDEGQNPVQHWFSGFDRNGELWTGFAQIYCFLLVRTPKRYMVYPVELAGPVQF